MTSGYNQINDKPTHYINELLFSSNVNLTKQCGVNNHFMKHVTIISSTEL